MSKTAVKKHWRSRVQDCFVPSLGSSGDLGVAIGGGADYGEFPFITSAPGGGLTVGDIILEIGGTPVLGMTLGDVRGVLNSCPHPVCVKTVPPGSTLCKDLRLYLSKCFTPGSVDSQLQQVIRENLYLRAVPCTTRQPRDGEVSGVDYNFVSIEEFFSLEESGALLESGKFKGNYYGTPRPVHISPESRPITYQEHRNLLRNFCTRSKSLSNLEKTLDGGENSEDDSGLSVSAGGTNRSVLPGHRPSGRRRAFSSGGDGSVLENGIIGGRSGTRGRTTMPDRWEQAFSDPGESYYPDYSPKRSSWRRETVYKNEWFTDEPEDLRGFPVHTHLVKRSRGFGFNIVGGSRPREFLQVYSVTASGPPALKTGDIIVYINDVCVLGMSHKEVVELLKSVPIGHSVDVEVRRGYPMLYNPDGRPKKHSPRQLDMDDPVLQPITTTQPQPLHQLPRLPTPTPQYQHFNFDVDYLEPRFGLDANGTTSPYVVRQSPPYRHSSLSNAATLSPSHLPRSLRGLARLQSLDQTQSDSEVVSAIGSHRASMIRNHNNNSLSTPQHHQRYGPSKSSESDLSTCTLSLSRLPLPQSPRRPAPVSPPSSPRGTQPRLFRRQTSHPRPSSTSDYPDVFRYSSFNSVHANSGPPVNMRGVSSRRSMSVGSGGELVPVALGHSGRDRGLGLSLTAGGPGGKMTVVRKIWDRRQCSTLQPGDAIIKINGADVQSLSCSQVQTILEEHTSQGEVILLVYRGGIYPSATSPAALRRLPSPHLRPPPPPVASDVSSLLPDTLPVPRTSLSTPPSPVPKHSSLIQSTSFLESIPVTLTMEPKDWINTGLEDDTGGVEMGRQGGEQTRPLRGFEVELRRKPGEGFGFVIASQDLENGKANVRTMLEKLQSALRTVKESKPASLLPHRFVTVRRGSPASKSGQIRPGDRLEAVEGRSVVTLPHRELAQLLRRAGNTLRITIVPRPSTYSSSFTETPEYDPGQQGRKGQRSRPKRDSRYYSVDLDRGSSGFGFSLRGGSEYNMGLYILGLMEGGPASRSHKIQVSDQLVEINGDSTAGMTHSQAVEQIRRGGHRIHLVLKKGNGYVPDYGHEGIISPPLLRHAKKQSLAAVDSTRQRGRSSKQKRRSRSADGRESERQTERRRRRRRPASEGGGHSDVQSPVSEQEARDTMRRRSRRRRKRRSQGTSGDALRNSDGSDIEEETVRGGKTERQGKSRSRGRRRTREAEEVSEGEQNAPAVLDRTEDRGEVVEEQEVQEERGNPQRGVSEDNVTLPIPNPNLKLPRPKINWDVAANEDDREQRDLQGELQREQEQQTWWSNDGEGSKDTAGSQDRGHDDDDDDDDAESGRLKRPLPAGSQTEPFSFLTSMLSLDQRGGGESESEGSQSDGSMSAAASISGLSLANAGRHRTPLLPGPWLAPSHQRAAQAKGRNSHLE
ncbi:membrane-associated guanylate kinase, WW and PDZ domain-containing protein 1 [Cynoglossus semilaevis]|uniref:membrane-associated guanylate kinase, WW and PDZ domain-containing protein 1 n=1 Tax=Cynoglossus semilaevis TaxID=244447 RepID=UPI000D6242BF|nr:membrane-associated guanylate kinase, WW and PDZ domain-containing protein 1-like [Cynoglossus semilaevis]